MMPLPRQWTSHSVFYLLALWSRLVSSVPYLKATGGAPLPLRPLRLAAHFNFKHCSDGCCCSTAYTAARRGPDAECHAHVACISLEASMRSRCAAKMLLPVSALPCPPDVFFAEPTARRRVAVAAGRARACHRAGILVLPTGVRAAGMPSPSPSRALFGTASRARAVCYDARSARGVCVSHASLPALLSMRSVWPAARACAGAIIWGGGGPAGQRRRRAGTARGAAAAAALPGALPCRSPHGPDRSRAKASSFSDAQARAS